MSIIIQLLFPSVIALFARIIIEKSKLKTAPVLDKLIYTIVLSISLFVIIASNLALLLTTNLNLALSALFTAALSLFIISIPLIFQDFKIISKTVLSKHERVLILFLFLIVAKIVIITIYRPIVDSDIIATYLPFARSIYLEDKLSLTDLYTGNEVTNPPIGGPILFATNYTVSGTHLAEDFILYTLPFLLATALVTYQLARPILNRYYSLVSAILVLSLPTIDSLLLEGILFPDLIMVFLGTTLLYMVVGKRGNNFLFIGLTIATLTLLKYQGLFIAYAGVVLIITRALNQSRLAHRMLMFSLLIMPIAFRILNIPGVTRLIYGGINLVDATISIGAVVLLNYLLKKTVKSKVNVRWFVAGLSLSFLGIGWFIRNKTLYGGFTTPIIADSPVISTTFSSITRSIPSSKNTTPVVDRLIQWLAIFILPTFNIFLVVPKIVGVWNALRSRLLVPHLYWVVFLCTINIFILFDANFRYLLPVAPSLIIITTYGLRSIIKWLGGRYKLASILILLVLALSMLQSRWMFRVSASIFAPPRVKTLSSQATKYLAPPAVPSKLTTLITTHKTSLITIFERLTTNTSDQAYHWIFMIAIGIGGFAIATYISSLLASRLTVSTATISAMLGGILILLLPYLVSIMIISRGHIDTFRHHIVTNIVSFQGESPYIVPYLVANADKDDKILKIGAKTGLAYQTDLQVINLAVRYGLRQLSPVMINAFSDETIYNYYQANNINYILLSTAPYYQYLRDNLDKSTNLLHLLENDQYYRLVIPSSTTNQWELYSRIDQGYL